MTWNGESVRHSLARRGIRLRREPWHSLYDVRGLEELVNKHVAGVGAPRDVSRVTGLKVGFLHDTDDDWYIVADASRFLDADSSVSRFNGRRPNAKQLRAAMSAAPTYVLAFDAGNLDLAYVFAGKGGAFVHPPLAKGGRPYKDNHYFEPIAYSGPGIVLPEPVTLFAAHKEPGSNNLVEIPFTIAGLVGLEVKVANEKAAVGRRERQLAGVA